VQFGGENSVAVDASEKMKLTFPKTFSRNFRHRIDIVPITVTPRDDWIGQCGVFVRIEKMAPNRFVNLWCAQPPEMS